MGLEELEGVERAAVNFGAGKVRVDYRPGSVSVDGILGALDRLHHPGRPVGERLAEGAEDRWWRRPRVVALAVAALFAIAGLVSEWLGAEGPAFALFLVTVAVGGYHAARNAVFVTRRHELGINTLLVVATLGALLLGLFEEAAILVVVFSLGDVLEDLASDRARRSIRALVDLAPPQALVSRDGIESRVALDDVAVGDLVLVGPGERMPVDGSIVSGKSSVDQAPVTGESVPIDKGPGDSVYAGTLNGSGFLQVRTTRPAGDNTLARIVHQVEEAQARKGRTQRFSERFGAYYTPAVFALALVVAVVPPLVLSRPFEPWLLRGLTLLVVSCSCALVLSVPVSIVASISKAARRGILIRGGVYLEAFGSLGAVVFDKTGTLTTGRHRVVDVLPEPGVTAEGLLALAASLELRSEHPLGRAIVEEARGRGLDFVAPESFVALPGLGAEAVCEGRRCVVGAPPMVGERIGVPADAAGVVLSLREEGKTVVAVAAEGRPMGLIALADSPRADAAETVAALHSLGVRHVVMLSGDSPETARRIGAALGIDDVRGGLLPEEKVEAVVALKEQYGTVAMVGDGINDAPALAAADIGIAMGVSGSDVALEAADMALMADDLGKLVEGVSIARRASRNLKQNVAMALLSIGLLVAAALLGRITLVSGIVLNEVSALLVIANGLRMLR